jgi:thiamine monophosphate synthase
MTAHTQLSITRMSLFRVLRALTLLLVVFDPVRGWITITPSSCQQGRCCLQSATSASESASSDGELCSQLRGPRYPPYLAIITEPDACDSPKQMEETYAAIQSAVSNNNNNNQVVTLVSIRLSKSKEDDVMDRALELTRRLVRLATSDSDSDDDTCTCPSFRVVCSSDWVDVALQAGAHGIHVKEAHLSSIPDIREQFAAHSSSTTPSSSTPSAHFVIGTSTHSVESALESFAIYRPDYYFVGTCFLTASHPEKAAQDLEGPTLPGRVRRALHRLAESSSTTSSTTTAYSTSPKVFAIGGIDESNCDQPIAHGADGVAVIRAVTRAENPAATVALLHSKMSDAGGGTQQQ